MVKIKENQKKKQLLGQKTLFRGIRNQSACTRSGWLWSIKREGGRAAGPTPRSTEGGDHARSLRPSPLPLRSGLVTSQMLLRELGAWLSLVHAHCFLSFSFEEVFVVIIILMRFVSDRTVSYTFHSREGFV